MKKYQVINDYEDKIEKIFDTEKEANDYISSKKCLDDKYSVNLIDNIKTNNKSILLSIRPEWVAKILNGEKTIEVRKQFPKDYVGWVYIYCTKGRKHQDLAKDETTNSWKLWYGSYRKVNGKVVARFWCGKIEMVDFVDRWDWEYETDTLPQDELLEKSCLTLEELDNYLKEYFAWGIYISKLEIFDKPRELREFEKYGSYKRKDIKCKNKDRGLCNYALSLDGNRYVGCEKARLTKAPQNYCYVEGEE